MKKEWNTPTVEVLEVKMTLKGWADKPSKDSSNNDLDS